MYADKSKRDGNLVCRNLFWKFSVKRIGKGEGKQQLFHFYMNLEDFHGQLKNTDIHKFSDEELKILSGMPISHCQKSNGRCRYQMEHDLYDWNMNESGNM